ncbi:MAG: hypothetical protein K0R89_21 [Ramlibacter sp.]|jgi:LysR family nitrogen assimilation transcriptional regulator|nr:hypothetical protein [Ramlibacter sp.]
MTQPAGALNSLKLTYFHVVGRCLSFRAAGRELGIAQSALSRHIQDLEAELGVVLLHRTARSLQLTEAGKVLMARASELQSLLSLIREDVEQLRGHPRGTVILALPGSFASAFLPQFAPPFLRTFPGVSLRILEGGAREIEEFLVAGKADAGVVVMRERMDHLSVEELISDDLYIVGRTPPGPASRTELTFPEIAALALVLPLPPYGTRKLLDDAAARDGVKLKPLMEVDSTHTLKQMVLHEDVYTCLPGIAIMRELAEGQLHAVGIAPKITRRLGIATPAGSATSLATRTLVHHVRIWTQGRQAPHDEPGSETADPAGYPGSNSTSGSSSPEPGVIKARTRIPMRTS